MTTKMTMPLPTITLFQELLGVFLITGAVLIIPLAGVFGLIGWACERLVKLWKE